MEKTTIQINKYADRFLIGNVNFKFASDKANADMARRTLRIGVGSELFGNVNNNIDIPAKIRKIAGITK